ncbi:MAG: hypothetical protein JXR77_12745, partial [Lentisphaeria bacterium]|nr:hypothetical protein [Lentisphaeria bacterium]
HLWRFEDVDPVGADIWDTYIIPEICRPVAVTVETARPELVFRFDADQVWACKLAALALHPVADAAAADWLAGQLEAVAGEFRGRAACLDAPAKAYDPPRAWQPLGMVAWPLTIEDAITPASLPTDVPPAPGELRLACAAMVRGEYEPASLAIRPLRDLGPCSLALTGDLGEDLTAALDLVHCNTSRGFNSLAYRIRPHTLRPGAAVDLKAHVTRQLVVTFHTRPETPPGTRRPHLQLRNAAGAVLLDVPIEVTVHPVVLDRDTPFLMGFFGLMPPGELGPERQWAAFEETLLLLRSHGMNAVSGGPNWRLKGWENGRPVLDLGEADRFFALLRKHGFEHPINGYGGCRFLGLHDGYRKGAATSRVEKESGLPYEEAFLRAWQAINEHASRQHWPTVFYAMCDETRVRSVAEAELEFMKTMAEISRRWPDRVRASGSYSVTFERSPRDEDDLLHWHQEFFRVLDISSLNNHDASVLEEARRLGREIHIYNQGRDRYSFGLYQWAEQAKGVRARWQWHLNILHGYQFFDLDGREPDTAMLCYGREGIYPTLDFERCREGAEDFHLLHTLSQRLEAARRQPERAAAVRQGQALLQRLESSVGVNRRTPPAGYDPMALKEELVRACAALAEDR